jgi:hypothetical protein
MRGYTVSAQDTNILREANHVFAVRNVRSRNPTTAMKKAAVGGGPRRLFVLAMGPAMFSLGQIP